jgi:hypothetical protein
MTSDVLEWGDTGEENDEEENERKPRANVKNL